MNARQADYMRREGLTHRDYYSPSRADVGVTAAHAWFEKAGCVGLRALGAGCCAPQAG
jgi:hypothetical protein